MMTWGWLGCEDEPQHAGGDGSAGGLYRLARLCPRKGGLYHQPVDGYTCHEKVRPIYASFCACGVDGVNRLPNLEVVLSCGEMDVKERRAGYFCLVRDLILTMRRPATKSVSGQV